MVFLSEVMTFQLVGINTFDDEYSTQWSCLRDPFRWGKLFIVAFHVVEKVVHRKFLCFHSFKFEGKSIWFHWMKTLKFPKKIEGIVSVTFPPFWSRDFHEYRSCCWTNNIQCLFRNDFCLSIFPLVYISIQEITIFRFHSDHVSVDWVCVLLASHFKNWWRNSSWKRDEAINIPFVFCVFMSRRTFIDTT